MSEIAEKKKQSSSGNGKKQEKMAFAAEISRVLHLMIHSLYTNKDIFLRELISNASDACDRLRYLAVTEPALLGEDTELSITLASDQGKGRLEITDNGIGMNREELISNLGTIARSGTLEFVNHLSGEAKKDAAMIGQFGVGFYSSFMVADKVEVFSRKVGEEQGWVWESAGEGEFTVRESRDKLPRGTRIVLHLRKDALEYADHFRLRHIVETYSDHIGFPIRQQGEDGEVETINAASALWTRPKSEITAEQYREFYHHVAHSPDEPWMTLHNKAEGVIEYTGLLFIPSMKPFDLFHPERRRRVKLFVRRVFITEENVDLVPPYLRFLRGVIDSQDLPLNISRETLQDNPVLRKIRENITSKVLSELKKRAESDAAGYTKFWEHFGAVLKEGLCEATSPKDKILPVCRFHSTHGPEMTSLADYLARMKEDQQEIYYVTGDDLAVLRKSPQLEGFISRGLEVLLLTDHVDDFWVSVVQGFEGKPFMSVTRAELAADAAPQEKKGESEERDGQDKPDGIPYLLGELKKLFAPEGIREVRTTGKLTETPACLAVDEGSMDFRMERFLMEHRQLSHRAEKILEINPAHKLVVTLADRVGKEGMTPELEDAARLLLDQARIIEGEPVDDAAAFARRLSRFMEMGLAG